MKKTDCWSIFVTTLVSALGLVACSNQNVKGAYPSPAPRFLEGAGIGALVGAPLAGFGGQNPAKGVAAGAFIGAAVGSYMDSDGLKNRLKSHGIIVTELGQTVELVLPADLLFEGGDTDIQRKADAPMEDVVFLLKQYGAVKIDVSAFTDNMGSTLSQLELSRLQGESVANYLWSRGIDLQRMSTTGYGQTMTAASDLTSLGSAYNRRVIIHFFADYKAQPARILFSHKKDVRWAENSSGDDDF